MGINSRIDLAAVNRAMQDRIQTGLMNSGVTIVDPDNTWIDAEVSIGHDTSIYPFTFIGTGAQIGERCRIGPFAFVRAGETVEDDAVVINTLGMEAEA
jgi:bifunctional UDP-N-acetylglucosamine pyrophosphorylase/glucosamine-1-phosphate N-acetyltransferase